MVISSIKEVGFPIVMCLLLCFGGWEMLSRLEGTIRDQSTTVKMFTEALVEFRTSVRMEHERMFAELEKIKQNERSSN